MNNIFFKARLRLTLLYIAIIVVLLIIFSQVIYISVSNNIRNNLEGDFTTRQQQDTFVQKQISTLQTTLLLANAGVLIIVGGLSFLLAGRTLQPIKSTMEQQKQFLSDASHELRTPLAILQTNMDVAIKERKKGTRAYQEIHSNIEELDRMTELVNELLLLSRLDTSDQAFPAASVNLSKLVQDTINHLTVYAAKHRVDITLTNPSAQFIIHGNEAMLSKAINNVLKNAIDYNRNNGSVAVSLKRINESVRIQTRDTGVGIASKHLPHIFNRFYKVEEARSEHKGSGLGLAITHSVIAKHKGTVTIESALGKGTTVTISLPLS